MGINVYEYNQPWIGCRYFLPIIFFDDRTQSPTDSFSTAGYEGVELIQ